MTQQEKLKIVIERAVNKGWGTKEYLSGIKIMLDYSAPEKMLFEHNFAKAYWGETLRHDNCYSLFEGGLCDCHPEILWQYHLQACVLSPDPIDYYYTNYKD